jgi:RimJ/RimL family protein N-acetyltransferase
MSDSLDTNVTDWKRQLPVLAARGVTLREPVAADLGPIFDLLSLADASRFGIDDPISELAVHELIERAARQRASGAAFAFAVTPGTSRSVIGLAYVKQLDFAFDAAEWDATLAPSARGTGMFLEMARLIGSFTFGTVGANRIEARVSTQNGRANGALRKLGAVQEGVLRRSARQHGEYVDQVLWSILKEDWTEHWVSTSPRVH